MGRPILLRLQHTTDTQKRGLTPSFDHEYARDLAAQGIPRKQIAQQLGCTKAALDYALNPKRKTK